MKEEDEEFRFFKTSGVSVTASRPDGSGVTSFYHQSMASEEIVEDSTAVSQVSLEPAQKEQMVEVVELVKKGNWAVTGIELGATWEKGFTFQIKREPERTVRYYAEKKK